MNFIGNKLCCRFKIPYFILQILLGYKLSNKDFYDENMFKSFINGIDKLKFENIENKNIYIILEGAAGDAAFYFISLKYLLFYLFSKTSHVYIVGNKKYYDIYKLFLCFFPELEILLIDDLGRDMPLNIIQKTLNIIDSDFIIDYRNSSLIGHDIVKYLGISYYDYCCNLKNAIINIFNCNGKEESMYMKRGIYIYDNLNYKKIYDCLSYSNNSNGLIICNFENRSFKLAFKDSISFTDYFNHIIKLSSQNNLKFVINSVYNNEKEFKDNNILVTRFNFQEIIWLAEHDKIGLFISERNGLNDIFNSFFPKIKQIIYYPDYYFPCVDKHIYSKFFKKSRDLADVKDGWHLPGDNVIEDIRGNFFNTIEKYIKDTLT